MSYFINAPLTRTATHADGKEESFNPVTVIRSLRSARKHVGEINRSTPRVVLPKEFQKVSTEKSGFRRHPLRRPHPRRYPASG